MRSRRRHGFNPWVGNIPWRKKWQPTPVFLPGESHGRRNLTDDSPCSRKESDTTEQWTLFPGDEEPACQWRRHKRHGFDSWSGRSPVLLPGESHGQRCLAGYCPWDRRELTERTHRDFTSANDGHRIPSTRWASLRQV